MPQIWDADVELTMEAAARLIEQQLPLLAPASLEPFGTGWDNAAYLVNRRWVFRFPRRRLAATLMEHETRVLPLLAPHLPLRITAPAFAGEPDDGYPYRFAGYELIAGQTACRSPLTDAERCAAAAPLANLLRTLHGIPVDDATMAWAPGDEIGRTDLHRRASAFVERLRGLAPDRPDLDVDGLSALIHRLADSRRHFGPARWVHGDLYARHLVFDAERRLVGVIDWGDVHLGDPALDISIAWSFLPPEARATFRELYGPISEATWDRARFRALHYGAVLLDYGAKVGDDAILTVGNDALRFAGDAAAGAAPPSEA